MESVLLNLAINARDAMADGGSITITTANETLDQQRAEALSGDLKPGDYVKISLSDTGYGMSETTIARSVEPFFTTKDIGEGTGLGLSMVYGFVKQSEGHAYIESAVGEATTVHLYLPRAEAVTRRVVEQRPDSPVSGWGPARSILVVEDDKEVRDIVVSTLNDMGHRVVATGDGNEALQVLAGDDSIDLLFSDVVMPGGIMGWQLAEEAMAAYPDLKVLLTTGNELHGAVRGDPELGPGFSFIRKPYHRTNLQWRIEGLFDDASDSTVR